MDAARIETLEKGMAYEQSREGPPPGFPKLPPIPAKRYTDQAFFDLEIEHLWKKSWLYACHMDELPEPGSFYLWERIGSPIFIVRGRDDKLRGFYNTCRHRGAPVVREQTGRRNLFVCTYHGWSYDDKGHLINMRDPRDFPDFDKSCHSLVEVAVEVFGKMVFVNLDKEAKPLIDYLHPVPRDMAQFQSENMRLVRKTTLDIKCNVKILLDAFQETYHLKSIHQKTVDRFLDHLGTHIELWPNGHSRMVTPHRDPDWVDPGVEGLPEVETVGEVGRINNFSYNIYPNIVCPPYASGNSLIIFWPKTINTMEIEVVWVAPDWGDGPLSDVWDTRLGNFDKILEEDTQFAEQIQISVESDGFQGTPLSYQERRIYHWHEHLDRLIGEENLPEGTRIEPLMEPYIMDPYASEAGE
jgi:phenylpropionate dioxygenase-like ring-hydroxylating dioxygenase large terminal subunit